MIALGLGKLVLFLCGGWCYQLLRDISEPVISRADINYELYLLGVSCSLRRWSHL